MDFQDLERNLQRLNVADAAADAINRHRDEAAAALRKQLYEGKDATGGRLRRYRSRLYAEMKNQMNPAPGFGNPDLYLTGAFHRSIRATVTGEGVTFDATDTKAADLVDKYSSAILDISEETSSTFAEVVRDDFMKIIANITGLDAT